MSDNKLAPFSSHTTPYVSNGQRHDEKDDEEHGKNRK